MAIWARLRRPAQPLMLLPDALDALGQDGDMGSYTAEVPLSAIVGSAARQDDFDADFTLVNNALEPASDRSPRPSGTAIFRHRWSWCGWTSCTSSVTGTIESPWPARWVGTACRPP